MTTAAAQTEYVITRYDHNRMCSVPIPGKRFENLDAALEEAIRVNAFKRYAGQTLMVDLASAYEASPA